MQIAQTHLFQKLEPPEDDRKVVQRRVPGGEIGADLMQRLRQIYQREPVQLVNIFPVQMHCQIFRA